VPNVIAAMRDGEISIMQGELYAELAARYDNGQ
jgi:hypothetical protein